MRRRGIFCGWVNIKGRWEKIIFLERGKERSLVIGGIEMRIKGNPEQVLRLLSP